MNNELINSFKAKEEFTKVVKGKNIATSNIIGYYNINNYYIEFSTGDFLDHECYGVCVVKDNKQLRELDKLFFAREEAEEYIKSFYNK